MAIRGATAARDAINRSNRWSIDAEQCREFLFALLTKRRAELIPLLAAADRPLDGDEHESKEISDQQRETLTRTRSPITTRHLDGFDEMVAGVICAHNALHYDGTAHGEAQPFSIEWANHLALVGARLEALRLIRVRQVGRLANSIRIERNGCHDGAHNRSAVDHVGTNPGSRYACRAGVAGSVGD